jgi:hypothetical protein
LRGKCLPSFSLIRSEQACLWNPNPGPQWRTPPAPPASGTQKKAAVFSVPGVLKAPVDATPADRLSGLLLMMGLLNYET